MKSACFILDCVTTTNLRPALKPMACGISVIHQKIIVVYNSTVQRVHVCETVSIYSTNLARHYVPKR